jgi:predicted Ser/Thr protein kinase
MEIIIFNILKKIIMTYPHPLDCWKPFLQTHNFNHLIEFIENHKNGTPNEKKIIILMGNAKTGKTRLLRNINDYLKDTSFYDTQNITLYGIKKHPETDLWLFDEFHHRNCNLNTIDTQNIIISMLPKSFDDLLENKSILNNAFIINMTHKF